MYNKNICTVILIFGFIVLSGCSTVPKSYMTQIWKEDKTIKTPIDITPKEYSKCIKSIVKENDIKTKEYIELLNKKEIDVLEYEALKKIQANWRDYEFDKLEKQKYETQTINVLNIKQQGQGLVHAKINKDGDVDVITDYKSTPLLVDITKLYAVKEIGKD